MSPITLGGMDPGSFIAAHNAYAGGAPGRTHYVTPDADADIAETGVDHEFDGRHEATEER